MSAPLQSNPGSGGYVFASDYDSGNNTYFPLGKFAWGEPGTTYNVTSMSEPLPVQPGTGVTFPVSAASLPLATNAAQETGGNLASILAKLNSSVAVTGTFWQATQPVSGTFWQATQPVSGTVTANAGTNLNTSLLALETGGNLASIATKIPAQGQALSASSMPVVLPASQITTLTPPAAITNYAQETGGNLATLAGGVSSSKYQVNVTNASLPVTGTFWQATQPVSAASLPLPTNASQETGGNLATIAGAVLAQGANTSGQTGELMMGAVTTSAPTYTTAKTNPLSLTTAGGLRVDGSGATQPVSGTVTANAGTNLNTSLLALETGGNLASILAKLNSSVAVTGTFWQATQPVSGTVTANAGTNLNTSLLALETGGNLATLAGGVSAGKYQVNVTNASVPVTGTFWQATQPVSGTVTSNQGSANATPWNENISQYGGSAVATAKTGTPLVGVADGTGNALTSVVNGGLQSLNVNVTGATTFVTGPAVTPLSGSITATGAVSGYIFSVSAFTCVTVKVTAPAGGCTLAFASSVLSSGTPADTLQVTKAGSGTLITTDVLGANATQVYQFNIIGQLQADIYATVLTGGQTITIAGNETTDPVALNQYVQSVQSGTWSVQLTDGANTAKFTAANVSPLVGNNSQIVSVSPNNTGIPVNLGVIAQKTSNVSSGSVASLAKAFVSNNLKGNSVVVVCAVGNGTAPTIADTNSNVYLSAVTVPNGSAFGVAIFYASNVVAGANTVTVTNGGSAASMAMEIYEVSGPIQLNYAALDQTSSNTGTGTALTTGAVTPTSVNEYAFVGYALGTGAQTITVTPGTVGWTNDSGQQNPSTPAGLFSFVSASAVLSTMADVNAAATTVSEPWAAAIATFRPVALNIGGGVSATGRLTQNNAAPAAHSNLGVLAAVANAAAPSYSEGNQVLASVDLSGNLRARLVGSTPYLANAVKTVVTVVSSAAGVFVCDDLINTDSAPVFLQCFDVASGTSVTLGTTVPNFVIPFPANSTAANGVASRGDRTKGYAFTNGLKVAATTTLTGSSTSTNGLSGSIGTSTV